MKTNSEFKNNNIASIIIPTYNRANYLINGLNTILTQTYRPIEIIIVDDGSEDNTKEVVDRWAKTHQSNDFKIRYIYQQNCGAPAARNTGIENAEGRYLQFFDSDDILYPKKISLQIELMKQEKSPISICDYIHVDQEGNFLRKINNDRTINQILSSVLKLSTIISVIDRFYFDQIIPLRWNEKLPKFQDRDFHHKLFMITNKFSYVNEVLFEYVRYSKNSIFQSEQNKKKLYWLYFRSLLNFNIRYFYRISYKKWLPLLKLYYHLIRSSLGMRSVFRFLR